MWTGCGENRACPKSMLYSHEANYKLKEKTLKSLVSKYSLAAKKEEDTLYIHFLTQKFFILQFFVGVFFLHFFILAFSFDAVNTLCCVFIQTEVAFICVCIKSFTAYKLETNILIGFLLVLCFLI